MSMYDDNDGGDLYEVPQQQQPQQTTTPDLPPQVSQAPQFAPVDAVNASFNLLSGGGTELLSEILPPNPADSKLPMGLAVLGACIVGILWADSFSRGGKRR